MCSVETCVVHFRVETNNSKKSSKGSKAFRGREGDWGRSGEMKSKHSFCVFVISLGNIY